MREQNRRLVNQRVCPNYLTTYRLEKLKSERNSGYFWPVSLNDSKHRYHWCHGSAGIAQAFLSLYRNSQNKNDLNTAVEAGKAALHLMSKQLEEPLFHCHGLAGILELFLDLEKYDQEGNWGKTAAAYLPAFLKSVNPSKNEYGFGIRGTSLALGSAGIIRLLLRFGGKSNIPILFPSKEPIELSETEDFQEVIIPFPKLKEVRSKNPSPESKNKLQSSNDGRELLPRIAAKFHDKNFLVILKSKNSEIENNLYEIFMRHSRSKKYLRILNKIQQTSRNLEREYFRILKSGVLDISLHGPFLREIAGISLYHPEGNLNAAKTISTLTAQYTNMLELFFPGSLRILTEFFPGKSREGSKI